MYNVVYFISVNRKCMFLYIISKKKKKKKKHKKPLYAINGIQIWKTNLKFGDRFVKV